LNSRVRHNRRGLEKKKEDFKSRGNEGEQKGSWVNDKKIEGKSGGLLLLVIGQGRKGRELTGEHKKGLDVYQKS